MDEEIYSDEEYCPVSELRQSTTRPSKKHQGRSRSKPLKTHKLSSTTILDWLSENYVTVPGSCLPRCALYTHYQDFCKRMKLVPLSAASFGKVVRIKFPNLSTRRLGTRGQSKYHYYGLAIRESSVYYKKGYVKKGITRFSNNPCKKETNLLMPSNKGSLLPEFPDVKSIVLPYAFPIDRLEQFMVMYRAHCQRVHDSITRRNFSEVEEFIIHFWRGMPSHMLPILDCKVTLDLIAVCDSMLYKTVCDSLIPDSLLPIPGSCSEDMFILSKKLVDWLMCSLNDLPKSLCTVKVQAAEMFGNSLRRQLNLMKLTKAVRYTLCLTEFITIALTDLHKVDQSVLCHHVETLKLKNEQIDVQKILLEYLDNLKQLLIKQSSVEDYFLWIDSLFEQQFNELCSNSEESKLEICHDFLLLWNFFVSHLEVELIIHEAKSQVTFKTVFLLITEYVTYINELVKSELVEKQYLNALTTNKENFDSHSQRSDNSLKTISSQELIEFASSIQPHLPSQKLNAFDEQEYIETNEDVISLDHHNIMTNMTSERVGNERSRHDLLTLIHSDLVPQTLSSSSCSSNGSPSSNDSLSSPFVIESPLSSFSFSMTDNPFQQLSLSFDSGFEQCDDFTLSDFSSDSSGDHETSSNIESSVGNIPDLMEILETTDKLLTSPLSNDNCSEYSLIY